MATKRVARLSPTQKVHRFASRLTQAVHDVKHEIDPGADLIHFWDDDSLFVPIRGVASIVEDAEQSVEDMLAQALYSSGFLGAVGMTLPHRSELLGQLATWLKDGDTAPSFASQKANFLRRRPITQVGEVLDLIDPEVAFTEETIDDVLRHLRQLNPLSFVYVEALSGEWRARWHRLVEAQHLLDMGLYGPSTEEVLDSELFDLFANEIAVRRGPNRSLATAIDAAALTALAILNQQSTGRSRPLYPRFFTSSGTLQRIYSEVPWVKRAFAFDLGSDRHLADEGTVWRDSSYYFLRSLFPALRLAGMDLGARMDEFLELQSLAYDLNHALRTDAQHALRLVGGYVFANDTHLLDIVDDLEKSRMSRVWLNYADAQTDRSFVASLRKLNETEYAAKAVSEFESRLGTKLQATLADRQLSFDMVQAVERGLSSLGDRSSRDEISLSRDLASVRWGVLPEPAKDRVYIPATSGHRGTRRTGYREHAVLYDISHLANSLADAERVVALLLGLEKFDLAGRVLVRLNNLNSESLRLMTLIANLASRRPMGQDQLERNWRLLVASYNALPADSRHRYCVGYGYGGFVAWSRSKGRGAWNRSTGGGDREWAQWCVDVVEGNLGGMDEWTYAFGVNHLVYVSTVTGIEVAGVSEMATDLERLALTMNDPLLLDTVGYRLLLLAEQGLKLPGASDLERRVSQERLARSVELLELASLLAPSDVEIMQHLELARDGLSRPSALGESGEVV
jgi:hypothetical protein